MYHRNSRGIFTDIYAVGSLELVHASSARRRLWDRVAEEIKFRKEERNKKEGKVREKEERSKMLWVGVGVEVGMTIFHFAPRGLG